MCSLQGRACWFCQKLARYYRTNGRYLDRMAKCRSTGRIVEELCKREPRRMEDRRHGTR